MKRKQDDFQDEQFAEDERKMQRLFEQHLTVEDLKADVDALIKFVESCGGKWQGLDLETLLHFRSRYIENWIPPFVRVQLGGDNDETAKPLPYMIFPADTSISRANYIAQLACPIDSFSGKERVQIKPKMHVGIQKTLFNIEALKGDTEIIPVVESADAAMSIWQATSGAMDAVALTSFELRTDTEKLLSAINEVNPAGKRFLILLDGDPTGRMTAGNLVVSLLKINVSAAACYFDEILTPEDRKICVDTDGRINANSILRVKGDEFLNDMMSRIITVTEKAFTRAEKEIADKRAEDARLALTTEQAFTLFQDDDVSDKAFAKRMEYLYRARVRWMTDALTWLIFDYNRFGGGLWKKTHGENSCLYPLAYDLSERLEANAKADNKHEKKIANAFKSTRIFSSTISMMKSLDSILVSQTDLDNHPELLNVLNGVVNLETGEFFSTVDPSLILTKQANAIYRGKNFRSATVDKFLTEIQPNAETRSALLRFLGYGTTGLIRDHVFHIWRGDGRNGKSTLLELLIKPLGTYCVTLAKSAVLDNCKPDDPNAPTPALTVLEGARLAIVPELPQTARINTVLMKHLCSGDPLPIRPLHEEQRTINPVAKYILNGNFDPAVDNVTDFGLSERIKNVPFGQTFTGSRADTKLPEKLSTSESLSAMLSILVTEAGNWFRDGLLDSAEMVAAKDAYIADNDFIGEFVSENCEYGEGFIELKAFVAKLQAKSKEASRTGERALMKMVKNWFKTKDDDKARFGLHSRSRRAGLFGIRWSYRDENFDDFDNIAPPN